MTAPARTQRRALLYIAAGAVAAAAAALLLVNAATGHDGDLTGTSSSFDPLTYQPDAWTGILTGPDATGPDAAADTPARRQAQIDAIRRVDSSLTDRANAETLAADVVRAAVSGTGRGAWPGYFPEGSDDTSGCRNVTIDAVNAQPLPYAELGNQTWAKALVVWNADCGNQPDTFTPGGDLNVAYVYLLRTDDGWLPVRPAALPGNESRSNGGNLDAALLDTLDGCTGDHELKARIEVASAWSALCRAAQADGIPLEATSAWRSISEQADLYRKAQEFYGDRADAYVAPADADFGSCSSKHCAGTAIDVAPNPDVLTWLATDVGCLIDGTFVEEASCPTDSGGAVTRLARYGFVQPLTGNLGHLEYAAPVSRAGSVSGADCRADANGSAPSQIAAVWRCRLARAGVTDTAAQDIVAQAVTVARCESNWDPAFVAFDGRFRDRTHPDTGEPYDAVGLFGMERRWFAAYAGDETAWLDPAQAADVAASAWLEEETYGRDGWQLFGCVAGDGILPGGLLDSGIPMWAYQY